MITTAIKPADTTQSAEEVLRDLGVGADGITAAQAQERLAKYGPNKLKEAEKPTLLQRFIAQLKDPMLIILINCQKSPDASASGPLIV